MTIWSVWVTRESRTWEDPRTCPQFRDRGRGFHEALARRGLRPGLCAAAPSQPEAAHRAATRLLRRSPRSTAVIAANFWLTIGTLRAAPEDMAVVGFDDFALADLLRRPVTTVAQPVGELGRQAIRLLLEEIAKPGGRRRLVLPPSLVVRGPQET